MKVLIGLTLGIKKTKPNLTGDFEVPLPSRRLARKKSGGWVLGRGSRLHSFRAVILPTRR